MMASLYQWRLSSNANAVAIPSLLQIACKPLWGIRSTLLLTEQACKKIRHRFPGSRVRPRVVGDRHLELYPIRRRGRIGESVGSAVITNKCIGSTNGIHLLFEHGHLLSGNKLVGVSVTNEDLRPKQVPGRAY